MKSPIILDCSPELLKTWWNPLEKAGFTIERLPDRAVVKSGKAKVFVHPGDGHLMLVFSGTFFVRKNVRLAQQVHGVLLEHCAGPPDTRP
jgi:hypothetical protein